MGRSKRVSPQQCSGVGGGPEAGLGWPCTSRLQGVQTVWGGDVRVREPVWRSLLVGLRARALEMSSLSSELSARGLVTCAVPGVCLSLGSGGGGEHRLCVLRQASVACVRFTVGIDGGPGTPLWAHHPTDAAVPLASGAGGLGTPRAQATGW